MSTQNERQAVMAVIATCRDQLCDIDDATDEVIDIVRAPLLSRIDALSKDAERYHKIKMFMHVDPDVGDDEYHATPGLCIAYDRLCDATHIKAWGEQSSMIDAAIDTLPAIDAAISAREGE